MRDVTLVTESKARSTESYLVASRYLRAFNAKHGPCERLTRNHVAEHPQQVARGNHAPALASAVEPAVHNVVVALTFVKAHFGSPVVPFLFPIHLRFSFLLDFPFNHVEFGVRVDYEPVDGVAVVLGHREDPQAVVQRPVVVDPV